MDTFDELCGTILVKVEPADLMEILNITTSDIVNRFDDLIMINQDKVREFLDDQLR